MKALFLDRDGVINKEKNGSYIFHKDEFVFYEGALAALAFFANRFDYLLIVTNQRGIGRGLMTEQQLQNIHDHLLSRVQNAGGRIDAIYFAPDLASDHPNRKPNTGMAKAAQKDFPGIDFHQSTMVGNNLSDMQFGRSLGMKTIFLYTTLPPVRLPHPLIDEQYASLEAFASALDQHNPPKQTTH